MSETKGFELLSATERASRCPETFEIPDKGDRDSIQIGQVVKLIFDIAGGMTERMWVQVTDRLDGGRYSGKLANAPYSSTPLKPGDSLEFDPDNIIDIWNEGDS